MFEVLMNVRTTENDEEFCTYSRKILSSNALAVEAGTTGYTEANEKEIPVTYFKIEDYGNTDMKINVIDGGNGHTKGLEVTLYGNSELETIIRALKFITKCLEDEANEIVE